MDRDWKGCHHIFTDASKHGPITCVGVGVFHTQYNVVQKIKLTPETSVCLRGECFGLYKAVEYILLMGLQTLILTDALSGLFPLGNTLSLTLLTIGKKKFRSFTLC